MESTAENVDRIDNLHESETDAVDQVAQSETDAVNQVAQVEAGDVDQSETDAVAQVEVEAVDQSETDAVNQVEAVDQEPIGATSALEQAESAAPNLDASTQQLFDRYLRDPTTHPNTVKLLQRRQYVQHTPEWYRVRVGMLTASDAGTVLGMLSKYKKDYFTLLRHKALDLPNDFSEATAHGTANEDRTRKYLEQMIGEDVIEVGLFHHPIHVKFGASPDGITQRTGRLVEIKNPLKRAVGRGMPDYYLAQCQTQMWVTSVKECIYIETRFKKPHDIFSNDEIWHTVVPFDEAWININLPTILRFIADLERCIRDKVVPAPDCADSGRYVSHDEARADLPAFLAQCEAWFDSKKKRRRVPTAPARKRVAASKVKTEALHHADDIIDEHATAMWDVLDPARTQFHPRDFNPQWVEPPAAVPNPPTFSVCGDELIE
jgi:putative phage-type endonuclease